MISTFQPEKEPNLIEGQIAQFVGASLAHEYDLQQTTEVFSRLAQVARSVSWVDDPYSTPTQQKLGWAELNRLQQDTDDLDVKRMQSDVILFCGRYGVEKTLGLSRGLLLIKQDLLSFNSDLQALPGIEAVNSSQPEDKPGRERQIGKRIIEIAKKAYDKLNQEPVEAEEVEPVKPYGSDYPHPLERSALHRSAMIALGELGPGFKWPHALGLRELTDDDCREIIQTHSDIVGELVMAKALGGDLSLVDIPLAQRVNNARTEDLLGLFEKLPDQIKTYKGLSALGDKLTETGNV